MVRPLQAGVREPSTAMHIQKVDNLGFPMVQTDWKNSTVAPSSPPGTSGNPVLKKKFCHFFDQPPTHNGPTAPSPSTAMHIQKVDTLGFPTVQTDWKNSTVAPSYPPNTFAPWFVKNTVGSNKRALPPCPTPPNLIVRHCRCEHVSCNVVCKPHCQFVVSVAPGLARGLWFF